MDEKIRWVETHCARMDHGGCGLLVGIRNGKIIKVRGNPDDVLNKGYICSKGRSTAERLRHRRRLRHPLKRRGQRGGGQWSPISWSEAIASITANLNRIKATYGARAIAFCQGMPKGLEHFVLIRLANLFGSPNVVAVQDVCHAPREISGYHTCGFYPVADYRHHSRIILLWGSNINATNEEGQICSQVRAQLQKGTGLIVIDPRRTELASRAKFWLQLRPGSDAALALAFLNVVISEELFDKAFVQSWTSGFAELAEHVASYTPDRVATIADVPSGLIRDAARAYAASTPAAIGWGNAIEQNTLSCDTARALICLMAICGNLDVPGGNIQATDPPVLAPGKFVRAHLLPNKKREMLHAHFRTIRGLMTVPSAYFKKAILEDTPYPVRGAYMQGTNPMIGYADSRKNRHYLHSSYRWIDTLRQLSPVPLVQIHPQTAAEHDIRDGTPMVIETSAGTISQFAQVTDAVKPGIIAAAYGWWFPENEDDPQFDWQSANYNMLTTTDPLGKEFGSPNLKGIPCRIRSQS